MTHENRINELEHLQIIAENLKRVADMQTSAYNVMILPSEGQKLMQSDNDRKREYEYRKSVHARWCKIYATAVINFIEAEGMLNNLSEIGIVTAHSNA